MESIQVFQRLRPLRHAFLVKLDDLAAATRAASLCSALWGGRFNPMVPADPQPTDYHGHRVPPHERRDGLLKAFDPDLLVNLTGEDLPQDLATRFEDRVVSGDDVIATVAGESVLGIGFSILPLLRDAYEKEVRFLTAPSRARVPVPGDAPGWAEFAAWSLGSFQFIPELAESLGSQFRDALNAEDLPLENLTLPADYRELLFPLQFTGRGLQLFSGNRGSVSSHIIFVGDHRSPADLMAFWNLRAAGRRVGFVPAQAHTEFEPLVRDLAQAGRYPINRQVMNQADLQKGPSLDDDAFRGIAEWVGGLGIEVPSRYRQPRFGIEIELYVGDIHVDSIQAVESEEISFLHDGRLTPVRMIGLPFADEPQYGEQSWSVDVQLRSYSESDFMFSFPDTPGVEEVVRRSALGGRDEVRLVRAGAAIALRQKAAHSMLNLMPVRTKDVFAAIFEGTGLETEPSPAGRYAEQVVRKMSSFQLDCRVFKLRGVREVLDKLGDGSQLTKGNIRDYIWKTEADEYGVNWRGELYDDLILRGGQHRPLKFGVVFDVLLDRRILRPGLVFKCGTCSKADWYHVSEFAENFTCRYCFTSQRVNFARAQEWRYRSDGMFRIPDSAQGSVAVLLSIWRFDQIGLFETGSYVTSFTVKPREPGWDGCEVDYAQLVPGERGEGFELVLGQATRFWDFKDVDIENMIKVADRFDRKPYLAFSTLRDSFSDADKERLRNLASQGCRVIAFTREELDPYDLFDRFEGAPHKYANGLRELAENTMHLNVGGA